MAITLPEARGLIPLESFYCESAWTQAISRHTGKKNPSTEQSILALLDTIETENTNMTGWHLHLRHLAGTMHNNWPPDT